MNVNYFCRCTSFSSFCCCLPLASEYGVHPTQISHWKRQLQDGVQEVFSSKRQKQEKEEEELKATLCQEIGQLKVELDWLKRKTALWS